MKKSSKALLTALCAVLLVVASVMGTMAYLTSEDTVTNTFTVGSVSITLDEQDVDDSTDGQERDQANAYKLMPGHSYVKDPTVHVKNDSEDSFIYVIVDNDIVDIESKDTEYANIATQIANKGWAVLKDGETTVTDANGNTVYYKEWNQPEETTGYTDLVVFENFKIDGNVANETLDEYEGETIVVNAYAVQKDGFASAFAAWNATYGATQG